MNSIARPVAVAALLAVYGVFAGCATTGTTGDVGSSRAAVRFGESPARHGEKYEYRRAIRVDIDEIKRRAARYGLVSVADVDPTILVRLRYSERRNVSDRRLYGPNMPCFVHRDTAKKLKVAQSYLRRRGLSLRIWDAWRPAEAHLRLWKRAGSSGFIADPRYQWSRHCAGRAVDVTLVDGQGREVPMPTAFDDFSQNASHNYTGSDESIRRNLHHLQVAMSSAGFTILDKEWWHFNDSAGDGDKAIYASAIGLEIP